VFGFVWIPVWNSLGDHTVSIEIVVGPMRLLTISPIHGGFGENDKRRFGVNRMPSFALYDVLSIFGSEVVPRFHHIDEFARAGWIFLVHGKAKIAGVEPIAMLG
jgi:hypothetical protein